ncbi:glycosyltransferase family 2 protein [Vibrio aestuarianus]|uniref:glycosyltransferase family 2 protein n=1 Tax=Vibrio aestuarianus TaxID=28171 RepID=UPI0015592D7C|nr:glycosyltransferase family 2 protein [Vibrio aestuarianus]NGZ15546.1 glycosyltransferase family 2 protein [Vibrio aestuarianus]NKZ51694.1 glycosyltransferase family 2 protein [Vibrio aestuarianus]
MSKVYTILVTYNPELDKLRRSVSRLKAQTDMVLVCNNSFEEIRFSDSKVKVFNFGENLGIAKAQSIGMKWAFEHHADFVLQMDQDSIPGETLVHKLLSTYEELTDKGYRVGLVGPQDFDKDTSQLNKARLKRGERIGNTPYISVESTLSSGSLIPKKIYELVGGMDDGLFIDAVDSEYCWRIRSHDFLIIKNESCLLPHKLGEGKVKLFGVLSVSVSTPIRNYYQVRNVILLFSRSYTPIYWKYSGIIKAVFKLIFYPFLLDNGIQRFKYILRGFVDGFARKTGRIN